MWSHINSLWHSDAVSRQRSESVMAEVIARPIQPARRSVISWASVDVFSLGYLETNFNGIEAKIMMIINHENHAHISPVEWRPFCPVFNEMNPFYWNGLTFIPAWTCNFMHSKVWDGIIYPFPNFNTEAVEVWERISDFTQHFIMEVITDPCWD